MGRKLQCISQGLTAVIAAGVVACSSRTTPPPEPPAPISFPKTGPDDIRTQVDELIQPLIDDGWIVGAAVALVNRDDVVFLGYGHIAADDQRRPSPETVFEIGAISKVFTGLVLADLVAKNKLDLDNPVQDLLPPDVVVPTLDGQYISLGHLASHTSGLPRMPATLPTDPQNPHADFTIEVLYQALTTSALESAPGDAYRYSILGAGLLGHALARFASRPYIDLVDRHIAKPLGMTSTTVDLSEHQLDRLALGHNGDGALVSSWEYTALAGAGGLRSTARDLAALVKAHIELKPESLEPAIKLAEVARAGLPDGDATSVGLGWHIEPDGVRWHSGQTGGYRTYVAYDRSRRFGVVVLANTSTWILDRLGERLFDVLAGRWSPLELPAIKPVGRAVLARYPGEYGPLFGQSLHITLTEPEPGQAAGTLLGALPDRPPFRLYPTSDTAFYLRVHDARIRFEVDDQGTPQAMVVRFRGEDHRADRFPSD